MHKTLTFASLAACLAATTAIAQTPSTLVFTGRFDFIGADAANERMGGSINEMSEFALNAFTPGAWTSALTAQTAVTHQAWMGDAYADGNYSRFDGFKANYFERWNFAGPFVKDADRAFGDITRVYWTVRDNGVAKNFTVLTGGGTGTDVIQPGDFFRWMPGGDVEFFIRQADFALAAGAAPPNQTSADGASAVCQDAMGNLYYSPAEGGHWVSGNQSGGPIFANDGSICMIPAAAITYDANGNVQSVQADSAKLVIEEVQAGTTGGPSTRALVANAGANAVDPATGSAVPATITANMVGLEIDPNGGTFTSSYATGVPPNQTFDTIPNLIFTFDSGTWMSTIFSTTDTGFGNGSIAVINGVTCGESAAGVVPDPTTYLGCTADPALFTPTTMGICLLQNVAEPLVADMPNKGALVSAAPTWDLDFRGPPLSAIFMLTQPGPTMASQFAQAFPLSGLPIPAGALAGGDYPFAFVWPSPDSTALLVTDANGYASLSTGSPWAAALVGATLEVQGIALLPANQVRVSNPIQVHVK